jgi:putrescine transport system permease protein
VRLGVDPKINAVSTLLIGAVAVAVFAAWQVQRLGARPSEIRSGAAQRQAK